MNIPRKTKCLSWAFTCALRGQPGKARDNVITCGTTQNPRASACLGRKDLYPFFHLWHLLLCPPPTASAAMCPQLSQGGGKSIPRKQFSLQPLLASANQVANSDVDTCPFGTGMKMAIHFPETIKHPVSKQQLSVNCNLGKTRMGHIDGQLPIVPAIQLPSDWWKFLTLLLRYSSRGLSFNDGANNMLKLSFLLCDGVLKSMWTRSC